MRTISQTQKKEFPDRKPSTCNKLIIGVTAECNSNCRFCVLSETEFLSDKLEKSDIKKSLLELKDRYSYVSFTGGEPTLRNDIAELIKYAKQLGYTVQLTTNGRLFVYRDFCEKIVSSGVDIFFISLSAHNARLYETLSRSKGSFLQVTAGITNLISLGQKVSVNTVVNPYNYLYLPQIAKFHLSLGIKEVQFTFARKPSTKFNDKEFKGFLKKDLLKIVSYIKQAVDIINNAGRTASLVLVPFCYMKGYEKFIHPYRHIQDKVIHIKINQDTNKYPNIGKFVSFHKNRTCRSCKHDPCCEGIEASSPFMPLRII